MVARNSAIGGKVGRGSLVRSGSKSVKGDLGPPRDFFGYGGDPPHAQWPAGARIAINFNLNVAQYRRRMVARSAVRGFIHQRGEIVCWLETRGGLGWSSRQTNLTYRKERALASKRTSTAARAQPPAKARVKRAGRDPGPARDFRGYGPELPEARWPGDARIAVNINLNVEAGGEHSILEGDQHSEDMLTDIGFPAYKGKRSPLVESVFEYGPRVGCWRLLRIFERFDVNISMLGVVRGMLMYPELTRAFVAQGHEVVGHGWRWLDYCQTSEDEEREHIRLAVKGIKKLTGAPPVGWFSGRSSINTRRLVVEHGGFFYDRDYLGDELPFWVRLGARAHLVIPYSLETNDNRFDRNTGFSTAEEFAQYMIDCFDLLYEEGAERPKIMSLALHDRLIGRPAKAVGLIKFLDHARSRDRVWFCTGRDIAEHWRREHPPRDK